MPTLPPPTLVDSSAALDAMVEDLRRQSILGVDTESNSLFAFRERVCLVQIATPQRDYLVDPLALADLAPLGLVFANPEIEKIFHAAEYDLLTLKRDYGFSFANLFDTMQAARILARPKIGLGDLLAEEFGVEQVKKHQRADWGQRPLVEGMLEYAQQDIHFLVELRNRLKPQLEETGRWPLAAEDFQRLAQANGVPPNTPELNIWRMKGVRDLSPQQCAILQRLAAHRHQRAEERDLPLFKVLGDATLVAIAAAEPANTGDLRRLPGMSETQVRRHGRALLQAVKDGLADKPLYPPRRPPYDEALQERLDALKEWRKTRAREMGVESDIILPRDVMETIASHNPQSEAVLAEYMHTLPYRFGQYKLELLETLRIAGEANS